MDPNAAAAIMRDAGNLLDDRIEAATALIGWLDRGGFPQSMFMSDGSRRTFGGNTAARIAARQEATDLLASIEAFRKSERDADSAC